MEAHIKAARKNLSDELLQLGWTCDLLHGLADAQVFPHMARALHGGEMSFSQLGALYRLYRNGPQSIAQLAEGADLSPPAASRMVDGLVRGALVERREAAADRRQKRVELTEAGRKQLRDMQAFTANVYAAMLADVPPDALRRLADVLEEIRPYLPAHPMSDSADKKT